MNALTNCGDAFKRCCMGSEPKDRPEDIRLRVDKRYSDAVLNAEFCVSSFIPECVRKIIKERKLKSEAPSEPYSKKFNAIILTCEIPAIKEVIDFYSVSINFTAEEVAEELDDHASRIMRCIKIGGGDIMLFEAGIFLCFWIIDEDSVNELTQKVLHVALYIQYKYGSVKTRFGKSFRNLIGISCGEIDLYFVGTAKVFNVVVGEALSESYYAMSQCNKKEVVVGRQIWHNLLSTDEYKFQTLPDEFVTVFAVQGEILFDDDLDDKTKEDALQDFEEEFGSDLNKYIHPLQEGARNNQQLQMLPSLTQVIAIVVLIDNLDLSSPRDLHKTVEAIQEIVALRGGFIKNIIHSPASNIIAIYIFFGFPGFKHGDDAVRAVLCSQEIVRGLEKKGMEPKIGISSSTVFCGMVGPPLRHIQCVLGMAPCVATRIANQFPDAKIVCCVNTFFLTRLVFDDIFSPVKKVSKTLKSTFASSFFEIMTEPHKLESSWKCIGRTNEKQEILEILKHLKVELKALDKILPLVIITGHFRIGKSVFLDWLMCEVDKIGFTLTAQAKNDTFEESYDNAWKVVKDILTKTKRDSDDKILEIFGKEADKQPLYLLNKLLDTSFEPPIKQFGNADIRKMMVDLVKECSKEYQLLIFLDNSPYTGTESWLFFQELLITHSAVIVATAPEGFISDVPFVNRILQEKYAIMNLRPLEEKEIAILSCQVLNVQAINNSILEFLQKHSEGNPLRLQEILMIPPIQKHFYIVPYVSVNEKTMNKTFYQLENKKFDKSTAMVCDVLDAKGLKNLSIPAHLLDIVRDHSLGLTAEEQMLVRKCALLGNSFGINILETVCPEYPTEELRCKTYDLVTKNILSMECSHLEITEIDNRHMIAQKHIPLDYCPHNLRFNCDFLRKGVLSVMPESQKERLELFLVNLLMVSVKCDTCKCESGVKRGSMYTKFARSIRIPFIDMRLCRCMNLQTSMYLQTEFHLENGKGPVQDRVTVLLKAAETGLKAHQPMLAEKIIDKAKLLVYAMSDSTTDLLPSANKVAIDRLRAQLNLLVGKNKDALRDIKHAMLLLNIMFPADIRKKVYKKNKYDGKLLSEEKQCLWVGCFILNNFGEYEIACQVGKVQMKILIKTGHTFCEIVMSQALLLIVTSKTKPSKSRETRCSTLINMIRHRCFKRLTDYPVLDIDELKAISKGCRNVILVLFEKGQLPPAEELGIKCFQVLKLVKHEKELGRFLNLLAYIYFYSGNYEKCYEMIGQLQDAFQQSGDIISEALYYTVLVTVLRNTYYRGSQKDKIEMCSQYAIRCPTLPSHSKFTDRLFCLSTKMALWSYNQDKADVSTKWQCRALAFQPHLRFNNFYALSGSLAMIALETEKMQNNYVLSTVEDVNNFKSNVGKDLQRLTKGIADYVPVLQPDLEETEKFYNFVINKCKVVTS